MVRLYAFLIGYVFGLFQTAFIVGKVKGIDIRQHGSGNAGTTNALRVLGPKVGLIVFAGDMLKGIIACLIVKALFLNAYPELGYLLPTYSAAGCVLAHDFPFYMHFKGGKGIAATGGTVMGGFPWPFTVVGLALFFVPFFLTHLVSLCSLLLYSGLFIELVIFSNTGLFRFGSMTPEARTETIIVFGLLMALAFWQHRSNIGRLLRGEENKTYLKKKKPTE
jgi:glycerol-3-phosphate acyltransferase PlsY